MITLIAAAAIPICSYIGDSIAIGLESVDRTCSVHAKVGATSEFIARNFKNKGGDEYTVISMGSNDPNNPNLYANALAVRNSVKGTLLIWVLPRNRHAASVIRKLAEKYEDNYVDLGYYPSNDNIHPKSYKKVVKDIIDGVNYFYD